MAKAEKAVKADKKADKKVKQAEVVKPTYLPRATEKAYFEQAKRTYIFICPLKASKQEIKRAIEKEYIVTVEDVRVLTRKGKKTRFSRGKHAYPGITYRRDHKLAYVTLKEGDKIAVFQEEEKTSDAKADKANKKAKKAEAKAAKKEDMKGDK